MKSVSGKNLCKIVEKRGWRLRRITGSHHIYTLESQLGDLWEELTEYEALTIHGDDEPLVFELNSLEALPLALIKARIATKLSQKDLAERLGLKEQQIQRYEATEYASANLARVIRVSQALGMKLQSSAGIEVRLEATRQS